MQPQKSQRLEAGCEIKGCIDKLSKGLAGEWKKLNPYTDLMQDTTTKVMWVNCARSLQHMQFLINFRRNSVAIPGELQSEPYFLGKLYESTFKCFKRGIIWSFGEEVMVVLLQCVKAVYNRTIS